MHNNSRPLRPTTCFPLDHIVDLPGTSQNACSNVHSLAVHNFPAVVNVIVDIIGHRSPSRHDTTATFSYECRERFDERWFCMGSSLAEGGSLAWPVQKDCKDGGSLRWAFDEDGRLDGIPAIEDRCRFTSQIASALSAGKNTGHGWVNGARAAVRSRPPPAATAISAKTQVFFKRGGQNPHDTTRGHLLL